MRLNNQLPMLCLVRNIFQDTYLVGTLQDEYGPLTNPLKKAFLRRDFMLKCDRVLCCCPSYRTIIAGENFTVLFQSVEKQDIHSQLRNQLTVWLLIH